MSGLPGLLSFNLWLRRQRGSPQVSFERDAGCGFDFSVDSASVYPNLSRRHPTLGRNYELDLCLLKTLQENPRVIWIGGLRV